MEPPPWGVAKVPPSGVAIAEEANPKVIATANAQAVRLGSDVAIPAIHRTREFISALISLNTNLGPSGPSMLQRVQPHHFTRQITKSEGQAGLNVQTVVP